MIQGDFFKLLNILHKQSFPIVLAFYLSLYSIINMTSSGEYFYSLTFEMKLIIRVVNSQKKKG